MQMITPNQSHNLAKKSFSLFEKINDVCLKDLVICSCGAKKMPKYYETLIINLTRFLTMVQIGTYTYMSYFL